jgi:hypothetical protein
MSFTGSGWTRGSIWNGRGYVGRPASHRARAGHALRPRPRQNACQLGHEFTAGNVRIDGRGAQRCAVCGRRHSRQYRIREKARRENQPATIALVVWRDDLAASWTYHPTRAAAAKLAPRDAPYTIVDVAREPWIAHPPIPNRWKPQ